MKVHRVFFNRLAVALSAMMLSACSVLPASETLTVYQLPVANAPLAVTPGQGDQPAAEWALRVAIPYSSQLINSQRILVQPPGDAISAYQGARWSDVAPVMLRDYLVNVLRMQVPRVVVSNDTSGLLYDLALNSDLSVFQVVYGASGPVVHIQLDASLIQADSKRTVAAQRFTVQQAVVGTQVPDVVAAFGLAANKLVAQIIDWMLLYAPGVK